MRLQVEAVVIMVIIYIAVRMFRMRGLGFCEAKLVPDCPDPCLSRKRVAFSQAQWTTNLVTTQRECGSCGE